MTNNRVLRNYKVNIESKLLENEHIIMASDKLKTLLDGTRSNARIVIYMYICMKVNKSKDIGYLRNIKCQVIADDLGIPLDTVQTAVRELCASNFISRTSNKDRSSDYKVIGYKNIRQATYVKLPGDIIFSDNLLQALKDELAGTLEVFTSIYANIVAEMKKLQSTVFFKDKENFELVKHVNADRVFNEKTLLKKIKRVSKKDLNRVLEKMKQFGLTVTTTFKKTLDGTSNYLIGIDREVLSGLFRPFISTSHIENNRLAFSTVDEILSDTGLYQYIGREHNEDLTQMYVEYGSLFFHAGVLALQGVIHNNYSLVDEDGGKIDNLCAYFRESVESFIDKRKLT